EVTNPDVFKIMEEEDNTDSTVIAKIANTVKPREINDSTVIAKIAITAKSSHIKDSTVIAKIADNLFYSNSIDTNRHIIDTETDQLQNQVLL
ncbi:replication protein RepA, partial [Enterococcus gallinarum]